MNELYLLLLESIENMVPFNTYRQLSAPRPAEITPICITPAICNLAMVAISLQYIRETPSQIEKFRQDNPKLFEDNQPKLQLAQLCKKKQKPKINPEPKRLPRRPEIEVAHADEGKSVK